MPIPFKTRITTVLLFASIAAASFVAGPARAEADLSAQYQAAIDNPLRTADDRKGDAKRKPQAFLQFAQVRPGMKVLDIVSGAGATSQLLALAVGSSGEVWAQNSKPSDRLAQRLAAAPQANIHAVVQGFDNPVPADAPPLDLITINMNYHDIVNTPTDRAAMNRHLLQALKPGGHLVLIDNAANKGTGLTQTNTLHRIEDASVIEELTAAGFALEARSDYLSVADDPRTQPFFKMDQPDDKFALRFVRK